MTWRDQLQPGKFRDAAFLTDTSDTGVGRRTVLHEYPLRDLPFAEDMGRKAREFTLECYVLGADYMAARDALMAAIEKPGTGTLVHPYLGSLQVAVTHCRVRESSAEGGMARFSITFSESGANTFPAARADSAAIVGQEADAALDAALEDFAASFSVKNLPGFVSDSASSLITQALDAIGGLRASFPALPGSVTGLLARLGNIKSSIGSLLSDPPELATQLAQIVSGLSGLFPALSSARAAQLGLSDWGGGAPPVPRTTANRIRQADNQSAIVRLVQRAALIEAVRANSRISYPSYNDAITARDDLAGRLDARADTASDTVYHALTALRVALVRDSNVRQADLPRITRVTPATTLPALVLAHQIYGDASRAEQLVARNKIRHPGFVPGGNVLEVLSDAA